MRHLVLPLVLAAAATPVAAQTIAIEHAPLACVPADRYARVAARGAGATAAQLQFRSDADGAWYSTPMTAAGGEWAAFLPRPARSLARLEYRIVIPGTGAEGATPALAARVAATGAECDTAGEVAVSSPIVVTVPAGAPVVPPVPAGFSPAGVVAAEERPRSSLPLKIAGAAVVAGVAAAAVAGTAEATAGPPSTEAVVPEIRFNTTEPRPGSTLSPNTDRFSVFMRLSARPTASLFFNYRVELISDTAGAACLYMSGFLPAQETVDLLLSSPLISTGSCGPPGQPFDTHRLRVAIGVLQRPVYEETLALPFHFVY
jgi:hypothetical protein